MVRVISQETYDEVVQENIQEFEMSPDEAVSEAIAQFEAQGVDLSNIIKDLAIGSGDEHVVSATISKLKSLYKKYEDDLDSTQDNINTLKDEIVPQLNILKAECSKGLAHRMRAGKEGAYKILSGLLAESVKDGTYSEYEAQPFIISVLATLSALMDTQPDLLEQKEIDIIKSLLYSSNEDILVATLHWASICCIKHEMNRQKIFGKNIGVNLEQLLRSQDMRVICESLQLIRKLTLDDDIRVEFGKAHDHARELGATLLVTLTHILKDNTNTSLVSDVMLTMASLLVRHELCSMVSDCGVDVLFTVLADNYDNVAVIMQASKLITALSGNDDVKRSLVKSGIIPVLVPILSRHSNNSLAAALILKCIGALSLRESDHSKQFLDSGAAEAIVECMKVHQNNATVQQNACWAIRNMVGRYKEQNPKFRELGVEAILNRDLELFGKQFGFDIKSALRDLDCDVKLDEQWTGKGVQLEQ